MGNIVRLYRGEKLEDRHGGLELIKEKFPRLDYADVPGLCRVATIKEIEAQGWSLNPGQICRGDGGRKQKDW